MAIRTFTYPATTISTGPIQFLLDGVPTQVSEDTGTPANTRALPVTVVDGGGVPFDNFAQETGGHLASLDTKTVQVDTDNVTVISSALPTGASTDALQTSGNASLTSIDGKTPALVSGRVPVDGSGVTQPVSGTVAISGSVAVTGPLTDIQLRATNVGVVINNPSVPVRGDGVAGTSITANTLLISGNDAGTQRNIKVDSTGAIQVGGSVSTSSPSVSATGSAPPAFATLIAGTDGATLNALVTTPAGVLLVDGSNSTQPVSIASPVAVTGPLTDTELRATPVPVSGPLTDTQLRATAVPVSLTSTTITGSVAVTGPLTDTQLRATPVPVSGTVSTSSPVNVNGSIVNTALTATTASSASAPSDAVGFIIEAPSTNTDNIRWCIGGTASTTVGMLAEPGRDSGFVPCATTISVCATVSGTNAYSIQWIRSV